MCAANIHSTTIVKNCAVLIIAPKNYPKNVSVIIAKKVFKKREPWAIYALYEEQKKKLFHFMAL